MMDQFRQLEINKRFDKKAAELTREKLEKCMESEEGRFMLIHLAELSGYRGETFTGNSKTFFNEGKRSIGIWIMETMRKISFPLYQKAEAEYESHLNSIKHYAEEGDK